MKVYAPQISIWLIQARPRDEIATDVPSNRTTHADGIDLTPYLCDNSSVSATQTTRGEAGAFTIRFSDKPNKKLMDSIYGLVEPMDLVEIRMTHDPVESGQKIPIIMRGLVSSVSRSEGVDTEGKPQRYIDIVGHNQMKILHLYRINYYYRTETGRQAQVDFIMFHTYAPNEAIKNMTAVEFLQLTLRSIVNPFIAEIASLNRAGSLSQKSFAPWQGDFTIDGQVSAYAVSLIDDESLYNLLKITLDIGPFNELYIEDREDATYLVGRPTPFRYVSGKFIQGNAAFLKIPSTDIVLQQEHRTDENTCNYFWVDNKRIAMVYEVDQKAAAAAGGRTDDWIKFEYPNCAKNIFGVKMLKVTSRLGPGSVTESDVLHVENHHRQTKDFVTWARERRKLLADMNMDASVFESGTLRLRGNHNIKAGMYLQIFRGPNQFIMGECYAYTVTHEFNPFRGYITVVLFDRGTFFITRTRNGDNPWIQEIESHAIYNSK